MQTIGLYKLIEEGSTALTEDTLPFLERIIKRYPYFSVARFLYIKNISVSDKACLEETLKRMTIYVPDRKKLFYSIEGEQYDLPATLPEYNKKEDGSFSLIDDFLATCPDSKNSKTKMPLLIHPSVTSDYLYWAHTNEKKAKDDLQENKPLRHHELIDSFLEQERANKATEDLTLKPDITAEGEPDEPEKEQETTFDDSYFTETLAHIYIKQKRYDKALRIIQKLSLNYPEKNIYFADQIRFLEKLIINAKK